MTCKGASNLRLVDCVRRFLGLAIYIFAGFSSLSAFWNGSPTIQRRIRYIIVTLREKEKEGGAHRQNCARPPRVNIRVATAYKTRLTHYAQRVFSVAARVVTRLPYSCASIFRRTFRCYPTESFSREPLRFHSTTSHFVLNVWTLSFFPLCFLRREGATFTHR